MDQPKEKKTRKYGTHFCEFMLRDFLAAANHHLDFGRIGIRFGFEGNRREARSAAWWPLFLCLYACTLPFRTIVICVVRYARVTYWYGQHSVLSTVHLRFFMYRHCFRFLLSIFLALGLHRNFALLHFVCTCFRFLYFTSFHLWCTHIAFHSCYRISLKRFVLIGFCAMQSMCVCDMTIRTNLWLISLTIQRVHCCAISITCPKSSWMLICLPASRTQAQRTPGLSFFLSIDLSLRRTSSFPSFSSYLWRHFKLIWHSRNFSGSYFNQVC